MNIKRLFVLSILLLPFVWSCEEDKEADLLNTEVKADFTLDELNPIEAQVVNFTDVSAGNPTDWEWIFEGGTPSSSTEENPSIVFNEAGTYSVTLKVSNSTSTDTKTENDYILVKEEPLIIDFDSDVRNVLSNQEVQFFDQSSGNPTSWEWTFEGGTPATSSDKDPLVTFSETGIHKVSLTVANENQETTLEIKDFIISSASQLDTPPFSGTIFNEPNIITESDPSMFSNITYIGIESRTMYDRRVSDWITVDAHIINAQFEKNIQLEVQVNTEFNKDEAMMHAEFYCDALGRIPEAFFHDAETVWIHDGIELFGGGNNNFLIHTGQGELYAADGILEETFIHEGAHTSLDDDHAEANEWLTAQNNDHTFISTYAKDNPIREDVAESYLMIFAINHKRDRISDELYEKVLGSIPERIRYFNKIGLNLYPTVQ